MIHTTQIGTIGIWHEVYLMMHGVAILPFGHQR